MRSYFVIIMDFLNFFWLWDSRFSVDVHLMILYFFDLVMVHTIPCTNGIGNTHLFEERAARLHPLGLEVHPLVVVNLYKEILCPK